MPNKSYIFCETSKLPLKLFKINANFEKLLAEEQQYSAGTTMSLEIAKICRTCLALDGGLLSIYDSKASSGNGCVADMLGELTSTAPNRSDGMPEKVCLACISEINRSYSFKLKCDNSDRMLRQLLNVSDEKIEPIQEKETNITETMESLPEEQEPQKVKADTSMRILNQEPAELAESQETHEIYSVQNEDDLQASYFVLDSDDDVNDNDEDNEGDHVKQDAEDVEDSADLEEILHKFVALETPEEKEEYVEDYKPVKTHSSTKKTEVKCTLCHMSFVHRKNLAKHLQKHHKIVDQEPVMIVSIKGGHLGEDTAEQEGEVEEFHVEYHSVQITESKDDEKPELLKEMYHEPMLVYRCPNCGAGFALEKSLNIHIKMGKCTRKQYTCPTCKKVFISQENLRAHVRTHRQIDCECDVCYESFTSKQELHRHKRVEHKMRNQCPTCNKVFTMVSTLKDHMRIHSGERPFLCPICGKSFSQNANLKQHVMRHNKTKPFKCEQCSRSFVSKGELFSHVRSHTGDHPFVCDVCQASFTTSSSLVKHKRIHTGERPYACDFCPMRFTALNTLKNHRRTHTGEKPFKCTYCQRGFAQKSDCGIHMRTHTGERRHVCQVCGTAFHQSGTLRAHMKTHREVKEEQGVTEDWETPDDEQQEEDEPSEEEKKDTVTLSEDDHMQFVIEECSSENNDYSGE